MIVIVSATVAIVIVISVGAMLWHDSRHPEPTMAERNAWLKERLAEIRTGWDRERI